MIIVLDALDSLEWQSGDSLILLSLLNFILLGIFL